jgi:hypothetical protein
MNRAQFIKCKFEWSFGRIFCENSIFLGKINRPKFVDKKSSKSSVKKKKLEKEFSWNFLFRSKNRTTSLLYSVSIGFIVFALVSAQLQV